MNNALKQSNDESKIKSITCDIRQYASVTSLFTTKDLLVWQCLFCEYGRSAYKHKTRSYSELELPESVLIVKVCSFVKAKALGPIEVVSTW